MTVYTVIATIAKPQIIQTMNLGKVVAEFATGEWTHDDHKFFVAADYPYEAIRKVLDSKELADLKADHIYDCRVVSQEEVTASLI